ncbi:hypothetical protein BDV3_001841 [Batrachochytrium dendrobatidis]
MPVSELVQVMNHMQTQRRIVFVGDEEVGKSAIINVLRQLPCPTYHLATIEDRYSLDNYPNVAIIDTAGASAFDRLRPFSYEGATDVVVCYAVDSHQSFDQVLEKWVPEVRFLCADCPLSLLATKSDLRADEAVISRLANLGLAPVTTEQGRQLAASIHADAYYECSAKLDDNVMGFFQAILAHTPRKIGRISLTARARDTDADSMRSVMSFASSTSSEASYTTALIVDSPVDENAHELALSRNQDACKSESSFRNHVDSGTDFTMSDQLDITPTAASSAPDITTTNTLISTTPTQSQFDLTKNTAIQIPKQAANLQRHLYIKSPIGGSLSSLDDGQSKSSPALSLSDLLIESEQMMLNTALLDTITEDEGDTVLNGSTAHLPKAPYASSKTYGGYRQKSASLVSSRVSSGSTVISKLSVTSAPLPPPKNERLADISSKSKRHANIHKLDLDFLESDVFNYDDRGLANSLSTPKSAMPVPTKGALLSDMTVAGDGRDHGDAAIQPLAMPASAVVLDRRASVSHMESQYHAEYNSNSSKRSSGWNRFFGSKKKPASGHGSAGYSYGGATQGYTPNVQGYGSNTHASNQSQQAKRSSIWSMLLGKK